MLSVYGLHSTNFTPASVQLSFHFVPKEFPDQSTEYHVRGLESSSLSFVTFLTLSACSICNWRIHSFKQVCDKSRKRMKGISEQIFLFIVNKRFIDWEKRNAKIGKKPILTYYLSMLRHLECSRWKPFHIVWLSSCSTSVPQPRDHFHPLKLEC